MINRILVTLFTAISIASFGQTDKFIEISLTETIELKPQSAVLKIIKKKLNHRYFDYDYEDYTDYADDTYYLDDEYHRMLRESPKKVTEEMRQAYQERQDQKELKRQERLAKEAEMQEIADNALKNLAEKLRSENFEFNLTTEKRTMNDDWLWDEDAHKIDSEFEEVLYVTVNNEEQYQQLLTLSQDLSVSIQNFEIIYEKIDGKRQAVIETLSKNAKTQAEMIAKSFNKKVGTVLTISNLLPTDSMPYENLSEFYDAIQQFYVSDDKSMNSPFSSVKKTVVGFVYRFALLD
jgi:hypothetical protein